MKVSFKLIQWILMRTDKHSQNSQNGKFTISLQYLIKEVTDEVGFSMPINIKVCKSWHYCFDGSNQARLKYAK